MAKWKIKNSVLKLILEASKDSHPLEFAALLRAKYNVIYELILIPTVTGTRSAVYYFHQKPIDFSIVGTVHSHPSGSLIPSEDDVLIFSRFGDVHIIVGYPYAEKCWKAYNRSCEEISIEVIYDDRYSENI